MTEPVRLAHFDRHPRAALDHGPDRPKRRRRRAVKGVDRMRHAGAYPRPMWSPALIGRRTFTVQVAVHEKPGDAAEPLPVNAALGTRARPGNGPDPARRRS